VVARRFHAALAHAVRDVCVRLGGGTVALSGGVFVNGLLACDAAARLRAAGCRVLSHVDVPPNDGGLSLGQLAVACARDAKGEG
jgi:hydrogenase maturation protein HypF